MATCYMRHSKIPVEENLQNEFKAHRDLSKLDLSEMRYRRAWTIEGLPKEKGWVLKDSRNRAAISKTICGMLNTGLKSTIYMGVTDRGQVEGFMMSLYQRDHFRISLRSLLSKFKPACPEHIIDIRFVPILDDDEEDGILLPEPIGFDPPRWKDHRIHEPEYCWCEASAIAAFSHGILQRFYVIEIVINQWDKNNPQNASLIREDVCDKRPIFANEFGKVYIRRNGYVEKVRKENLRKLENDSYLDEETIPKIEQFNNTYDKEDDNDTEYFSYESD